MATLFNISVPQSRVQALGGGAVGPPRPVVPLVRSGARARFRSVCLCQGALATVAVGSVCQVSRAERGNEPFRREFLLGYPSCPG